MILMTRQKRPTDSRGFPGKNVSLECQAFETFERCFFLGTVFGQLGFKF